MDPREAWGWLSSRFILGAPKWSASERPARGLSSRFRSIIRTYAPAALLREERRFLGAALSVGGFRPPCAHRADSTARLPSTTAHTSAVGRRRAAEKLPKAVLELRPVCGGRAAERGLRLERDREHAGLREWHRDRLDEIVGVREEAFPTDGHVPFHDEHEPAAESRPKPVFEHLADLILRRRHLEEPPEASAKIDQGGRKASGGAVSGCASGAASSGSSGMSQSSSEPASSSAHQGPPSGAASGSGSAIRGLETPSPRLRALGAPAAGPRVSVSSVPSPRATSEAAPRASRAFADRLRAGRSGGVGVG